jgi:hypothetical protein
MLHNLLREIGATANDIINFTDSSEKELYAKIYGLIRIGRLAEIFLEDKNYDEKEKFESATYIKGLFGAFLSLRRIAHVLADYLPVILFSPRLKAELEKDIFRITAEKGDLYSFTELKNIVKDKQVFNQFNYMGKHFDSITCLDKKYKANPQNGKFNSVSQANISLRERADMMKENLEKLDIFLSSASISAGKISLVNIYCCAMILVILGCCSRDILDKRLEYPQASPLSRDEGNTIKELPLIRIMLVHEDKKAKGTITSIQNIEKILRKFAEIDLDNTKMLTQQLRLEL